jgi:cullin-4
MFRDMIVKDTQLNKFLVDAILAEINTCRDRKQADREVLSSLIHMFMDLQVYFIVFEGPFLNATDKYYQAESERLLESMEPAEYLKHVIERMEFESQFCYSDDSMDESMEPAFVETASKGKLISSLHLAFVHSHVDVLLERSFFVFADQKKFDSIATLYSLLKRSEEKKLHDLTKMKTKFGQYILDRGMSIVVDPAQDNDMIRKLLELQAHVNQIIDVGCEGDHSFKEQSKDSFTLVLNKRQNKPAELIALFVDRLLKTNKLSEQQVEEQLNQCLSLFRLVQGKDIFEAFYGKTLAKRLLLNKSASVDSEKSMLTKLRSECGAGFTSKLEGMFKDMDLSKDIMTSFASNQKYQDQLSDMEMVVNVLTSGYWPTYPQVDLVLPSTFVQYQKVFESFFLSKHSGRRLTWVTSLGHCLLTYQNKSIQKELVVSLFQTVVLLLFNEHTTLSTKEIQEQTRLDDQDLERTLQSLALAKVKLLKKSPHTRNVSPTDTWTLNSEFTHPQRRIVVNQIQAQETKQEIQSTTERVFEDRQYQVDCALVRIMKTDKRLSYKELVAKLLEACKFPIQVMRIDLDVRCEKTN